MKTFILGIFLIILLSLLAGLLIGFIFFSEEKPKKGIYKIHKCFSNKYILDNGKTITSSIIMKEGDVIIGNLSVLEN
jgi:uncharacterized protein YneF (UPF0154 family)